MLLTITGFAVYNATRTCKDICEGGVRENLKLNEEELCTKCGLFCIDCVNNYSNCDLCKECLTLTGSNKCQK